MEILSLEGIPESGQNESGIYLISDGVLEISETGYSTFKLEPEHAHYLAAQLTKWADAQEEKI